MSTRTDHYKNLWKKQKEEIRNLTIAHERMAEQIAAANHKCGLLGAKLERVRSRKWFQFWKFFKNNQLI